jgi:two-component system sensor histidine kinase ChiS
MQRLWPKTFFLILAALFSLSACASSKSSPTAVNGRLDLSAWDFSAGEAKLGGEWQFYWSRMLSPGDFATDAPPSPTGVISLPGVWNRYRIDGERLGPFGVATFRLRVILPETDGELVVRMKKLYSAYRLWVDGTLVGERGKVGESRGASAFDLKDDVYRLPVHGTSAEFILQVSNYRLQQGGVPNRILLGYRVPLQGQVNAILASDFFLAGGFLLLGFFFLGWYLVERRVRGRADANGLLFFVVCLLWGGQRFLHGLTADTVFQLLPMPYETYIRLDFLIFYLMPPAMTLLFSGLYPAESLPKLNRVWLGAAGIYTLGTLFLPPAVYSQGLFAYEILTALQMFYILWIIVRAIGRGREGAVPMMVAATVWCLAAVNDMLFFAGYIHSVLLNHYGALFLVLIQAFILTLRSTRARQQVEKMGHELEEKNLALERADRLKDEFLANSSHELRTPLNGIIGLTESLRGEIDATDAQLRDLDLIAASGRRLSNLVNDILDFSKLKNRELTLNKVPVDLRAVADAVMVFCSPLAGAKALALHNDVPADLPKVFADEDRLQQILYNLVGNAIKFTEAGEVRIMARAASGRIRISVKDTGIGIPEAVQGQIFAAFEQGDGSASRNYGGTGLGLGITRKLVALHGGDLAFDSTPGLGTIFYFSLEVSSSESGASPGRGPLLSSRYAEPLPVTPGGEMVGNPSGKRVLLVDDDPVNLQVATNHLAARGLLVTPVTGGREALALIERGERFDLALLDVMMPGINGFEVCRLLRHRYNSAELPVIMVTAKNRLPDLVEGLLQGANDYLAKPYTKEELLARTAAQLQVRQAHLALAENEGLKELLAEQAKALETVQARISESAEAADESQEEAQSVSSETASAARQQVVDLMNRVLDLWGRHTATSKVELARRSGLWKIYMNPNGWERTQTLDRYLTLATLPRQPRRRVVIRTAEYVLKHCPGETEAHVAIRELLEGL